MLALRFPSASSRPNVPLAGQPGAGSFVAVEGQRTRRRGGVMSREDEIDVAAAAQPFGRTPVPRLSGNRVSPIDAASSPAGPSSFVGAREQTYDGSLMDESRTPQEATLKSLPPSLSPELMPRHVAFIMDGNSRWARERGLPTSAGHSAGYRSLREIVQLSAYWGVKVLTVFAFSSENWLRPKVSKLISFPNHRFSSADLIFAACDPRRRWISC